MNKEIKEYGEALQDCVTASHNELKARDASRKAHYRLRNAREALRMKEVEIIEDLELGFNQS